MTNLDYTQLALSGVRQLQPYQAGKPIEELEREFGLSRTIKLASNENPLGPGKASLAAIVEASRSLGRYPDGNGFELKNSLSKHLGVAAESITIGNGSNEILELVARTFVAPEHEVMFSQHAFAVYPLVTQAIGASAVITPARDWGHDLEAMLAAISDKTRLIFIANPNNPTGTWLSETELRTFLDAVPENILVVLDEAYFEYVEEEEYPDGIRLLADYRNLIVTRTFSKIHGLAGLRVGYGIASPVISDLLNRVRQPFNVNTLAQAAAIAALTDTDHVRASVQMNRLGLQQLALAFADLQLETIPSVGNFICVKCDRPALDMYQGLLRTGVIVRPVANYEMPEYLRITVSSEEENLLCLDAFKNVREELV